MTLFEGILKLLFKAPLLLVSYVFRNKVVLVLVVIGVLILVGRGVWQSQTEKSTPGDMRIREYQKQAPEPRFAGLVVQTESRIYYVRELEVVDGVNTMLWYYAYEDGTWSERYVPFSLNMPHKIHRRG